MGVLPEELFKKRMETFYGDAWRYADIMAILDFLQNEKHPYMPDGGCVLNDDLSFTWDVWHYEYDLEKDMRTNRIDSFDAARSYIRMYVKRNGYNYYFTLDYSDCYESEKYAIVKLYEKTKHKGKDVFKE